MSVPACKPAVLLFRGRGLISMLIRWQTRSVYSHAAILMPDGRVVEAWQGSGVRVTKPRSWRHIDRYEVAGMDEFRWERAINFALNRCGCRYDYRGVLRFLSHRRMKVDDRWFCSELVFEALRYAGVEPLLRIRGSEVSPAMLSLSPLLTPQQPYESHP